jgi:hypothetical protein
LRASTSWNVTRPMRFVSKALAALRKGPAYWKHLYAVRAQVIENWRRANPTGTQDHAVPVQTQISAARPVDLSKDMPTLHRMPSGPALSTRAADALRRARISSGQH